MDNVISKLTDPLCPFSRVGDVPLPLPVEQKQKSDCNCVL